jgi:hypothetical protein
LTQLFAVISTVSSNSIAPYLRAIRQFIMAPRGSALSKRTAGGELVSRHHSAIHSQANGNQPETPLAKRAKAPASLKRPVCLRCAKRMYEWLNTPGDECNAHPNHERKCSYCSKPTINHPCEPVFLLQLLASY